MRPGATLDADDLLEPSGLREVFRQAHPVAKLVMVGLDIRWCVTGDSYQMLTGRLPGKGPDLVRRNQGWLAILLLLAVLGYWRWEWQQAPNGLLSTFQAGNFNTRTTDTNQLLASGTYVKGQGPVVANLSEYLGAGEVDDIDEIPPGELNRSTKAGEHFGFPWTNGGVTIAGSGPAGS